MPPKFASCRTISIRIGSPTSIWFFHLPKHADLVHALDDFLQKSTIGSAVTGVMDEIWSTLGGPRAGRSSRPPPPAGGDPLDEIFDRILAGDVDADRLIDQLVDAGLDAEEIERRLARRRKK